MPAARPTLERIPTRSGETAEPVRLGAPGIARQLNDVVLAARSGRCALVRYRGAERLVEPYALRRQKMGNVLLYVWERAKNGKPTEAWRTYDAADVERATVTDTTFEPRHEIEL